MGWNRFTWDAVDLTNINSTTLELVVILLVLKCTGNKIIIKFVKNTLTVKLLATWDLRTVKISDRSTGALS